MYYRATPRVDVTIGVDHKMAHPGRPDGLRQRSHGGLSQRGGRCYDRRRRKLKEGSHSMPSLRLPSELRPLLQRELPQQRRQGVGIA